MDGPLKPLIDQWMEKIRRAKTAKRREFGEQAEECMRFYDGPHDHVYEKANKIFSAFKVADSGIAPKPTFHVTINKAAEFEQLMAPVILHNYPTPVIRPRDGAQLDAYTMSTGGMPFLQALVPENQGRRVIQDIRARSMEAYLKYCAEENDLLTNGRLALTEALIKGRGVVWPEIYQPSGMATKTVGAFYGSVDELLIDPDAKTLMDALWIARERTEPWWLVEERFRVPRGTLREYATKESTARQAQLKSDPNSDHKRRTGSSADVIHYYEIYSKMGAGGRLAGFDKIQDVYAEIFDVLLGDNVFLAICEKCPYPLNVPFDIGKEALTPEVEQEILGRFEWPIPYWADGWPFVPLDIDPHPEKPWPVSRLTKALGELGFMDWTASFLADAMVMVSRQFIAVAKDASEDFKNKVAKGDCFSVIEFERSQNRAINEMVQFLQHPPISPELLRVFQLFSDLFDKRVGLTELVYGQSARQIRSAAEAASKTDAMSVRPNDLSKKVEAWMKRIYRHMAMAARWHIGPQDIMPVLGGQHAMLWEQFVYSASIEEVTRELDYTIEAGSGRAPNKQREAENMTNAMQIIMPFAAQWAAGTGNTTLINQLFYDWCRANDLDPGRYVVPPIVPQAPPMPGENQPEETPPPAGEPTNG